MVLVTGGLGFLGSHVVRRLRERGERVLVIDNASTARGSSGADTSLQRAVALAGLEPSEELLIHAADLCSYLSLSDLCGSISHRWQGEGLSEIWHLASPASPRLYKRQAIGTLRLGGHVLELLLKLAYQQKARLLYASSSEVYGDPSVVPTPETEPSKIYPVGPRSMYDAAKVYGEALCAAYAEIGVDVRIARVFNSYGPHCNPGDGRVVPALLAAARDGREFQLHGTGQQTRSFCYVDDTVDGLFSVMEDWTSHLPVNVGSDEQITIWQLMAMVSKVTGKLPQYSLTDPQDCHDPNRRQPDTTLLRSLGWSQRVSLEEGLSRTWEWVRALPADAPVSPR